MQRLRVVLDSEGHPNTSVPFELMWELIEYLSYQRAAVSYQYEASHFRVTFTRQDIDSSQALLDEWCHIKAPAYIPA